MKPELRHIHRRIWQLWALLLPLSFGLAVLVLPTKVTQPVLYDQMAVKTSKIEQTQETDWLRVQIRAPDEMMPRQLQIVLKKPLKVPVAQVFWQNVYIGRLGAKGTHYFLLDSSQVANPPYHLDIRDPINKAVLQTITFHP
ncbi:MAG TPA: hypothetical protein PKC76_07795 [Saprospiraceae bacterium]|nr:hypothetical protein [Saprospiraceae bacterium]HMP24017.1 hypothetical protein [Saprospiraceae bacterium]